jgi:hypothetical protein
MTCQVVKQDNYYILQYTPIMHGLKYWVDLNGLHSRGHISPSSWEHIIRNPGDMFTAGSLVKLDNISGNILLSLENGFEEFMAFYKSKKVVNLHFILSDIVAGDYDLTKNFNLNLAKMCMWKEFSKFVIGIDIIITIWKDDLPTNINTIVLNHVNYKFLANYCLAPGGRIYTNSITATKQHNVYAWIMYKKAIFQNGLSGDEMKEINNTYFDDLFTLIS